MIARMHPNQLMTAAKRIRGLLFATNLMCNQLHLLSCSCSISTNSNRVNKSVGQQQFIGFLSSARPTDCIGKHWKTIESKISYGSCSYSTDTKDTDLPWTDITHGQLMSMIKSKDIQLFDVRTPEELVETGIIPGATNVPLSEIGDAFQMTSEAFQCKYGVDMPQKDDANIVLHCLGGFRSRQALSVVHEAGFHRARHYLGGWMEYADLSKTQ